MIKVLSTFILFSALGPVFAQNTIDRQIRRIQLERFDHEVCLDFIRPGDLADNNLRIDQIIIIRHGEPAMDKKGWKDRDEAIRYVKMYDSVGVYYNDSGARVNSVDLFGQSDQGELARVETLKSAVFWFIWYEFHKNTDVNRL